MHNERKMEIVWALSSRTRKQLGSQHIKFVLDQPDPERFCRQKLEPGYTYVPEAYEELLGVLRKEER